MKVAVLGLWHLGSVTAACLARHHHVVAIDFDANVVARLQTGQAPLFEPGLDGLLAAGLAQGRLHFSTEAADAAGAEVVWVCYDTPVDSDDRSDLPWVDAQLDRILPGLKPGTVVLLSSQMPVGTCAGLRTRHPGLHFACSPENLRLGKAIEAFEKPARIVVGVESPEARAILEPLLLPIGAPLLWMRVGSAEMVKHALNSFLALSVAFINEIAAVGEGLGADAQEVAAGLKSDVRIGPRAYLGPGGPFAGGTLARDVVTLSRLGEEQALPLALIPAIKSSNDRHRGWAFRKLEAANVNRPTPTVAVLGLAYTPNTNTLRRSAAVELCRQILAAGWRVQAFDPMIRVADSEHREIPLFADAQSALSGTDAVVICTEWPEFKTYPWVDLLPKMARPLVIDANRFLEKSLLSVPGVAYVSVGRP